MSILNYILLAAGIMLCVIVLVIVAVMFSCLIEVIRDNRMRRRGENPYLTIAKDKKSRESQRGTGAE